MKKFDLKNIILSKSLQFGIYATFALQLLLASPVHAEELKNEGNILPVSAPIVNSIDMKQNSNEISNILLSSVKVESADTIKATELSKVFAQNLMANDAKQSKEITDNLFDIKSDSIQQKLVEIKVEEKQKQEDQAKIVEQQRLDAEKAKQDEQARLDAQKKQKAKSSTSSKATTDGKTVELNGKKYQVIAVMNNTKLTGYDNGIESTGKTSGNKGFGVTRSGSTTHWGTAAIDKSYHNFGDLFYVVDNVSILDGRPNGKIFVAEDTGSAIKGEKRLDLWFSDHQDALDFGVRNSTVYQLRPID